MASETGSLFTYDSLIEFASNVLIAAGMPSVKASIVANGLVHAHGMGRPTHGLALLPRYATEIFTGVMKVDGDPTVLSDTGPCVTWDGNQLPGIWLTHEAVTLGISRALSHGIATIVVRRGHHIGCLATYLRRPTSLGLMAIIATSDSSKGCVAPFGGTRALLTTNPIAVGIPTDGDPILVDTSSSVTTNNLAATLARNGQHFDSEWLLDSDGEPSNDPRVLAGGGTILPAGGVDHGHKGYGWAILVEALTQGLSGFGRSDEPSGSAAGVFVQIIDPGAFGGREAYTKQTSWLAEACQSNPPRNGVDRVRMPGEAGTGKWKTAVDQGIVLAPPLLTNLELVASQFGETMPATI